MKKTKKKGWALLELPKTRVDENIPFSFKLYRFRYDGVIFLVTGLVVPFLSLLLFRFLGGMGTDAKVQSLLPLFYFLIQLVCLIIAIVYFYQKDASLFIKSGLFIIYAFQILPTLLVLIFSFLLNAISNDPEVSTLVSLWIQILSEVLILAFAMWWTADVKDRILLTFKKAWRPLLIVFVVGTIVMVATTIIYGLLVQNTPLGETSANQSSLTGILNSQSLAVKILGVFSLFALTVLVAPLTEELATRHAWHVGTGNRTLAWITSAIFFGMMHVQTGDVEHILDYFLAGLILATVFNLARGNVTYSWAVHFGSNLVAFLITVGQSF